MQNDVGHRSSNIKVTRKFAIGFAMLIGSLFLIAGAALISIASEQNSSQILHSEIEVARSIKANLRFIGTAIKDNAFWDDAYRYAGRKKVDLDWAYERDNLGASLFTNYEVEGAFIVGPDQNTRYAVINGALSTIAASRFITGDIGPLMRQARRRAVDDEVASGYYLVSGRPALVYAAALKPSEMTDEKALAQVPVLIFVDIIDVAHLGQEFGVRELQADADTGSLATHPYIDLQADHGMKFRLRWAPDNPGSVFLRTLLPLLTLTGCLFGALLWYLQRRMLRTAALFDAGQQALELSEERFRSVAEASSDWIWETDAQGVLTFVSQRFQALTGYTFEESSGAKLCHFINVDWEAFTRMAWSNGSTAGGRRQIECSYKDAGGRQRHCTLSVRVITHNDTLQGFRGTVSDVTEEVEAKLHITHMSHHDALTGLANRSYLSAYLKGKLASPGEHMYLLSLDLDRFKPVNDTLGHAAGDRVLCEIARRLTQCVRSGDLVARLGGDEFILVITHLPPQYDVEQLCARICNAVSQPISCGEHEIQVGASIGVVHAPKDGDHPGDLLRYADIALYEAKAAGRNNWQFYAAEMNERILERRQVETDLRNALSKSELFLEFQPRFLVDGRILSGAEALLRWNHPVRGRMMPGQFIAVAEETGLIVSLSDWVLHNACLAACSWDNRLAVSVNLSPIEFQRGDLVSRVRHVLAATGLEPARLELEITETVLLEDAASALAIMNDLKRLGVRLSMDDFGTGYSSLSYLRTYPFDGLKIDRSFVADLQGSTRESGRAVIESIIGLGRALALTVTAEGVETSDQLDELAGVNCDEAQGYFLGRPLSLEAFDALALEHKI
jgi:diguanylate cyclase (GGDEF)-like protein/PAS domain S-box-containing protein